jgi:hypothetical protein
MSLSLLLPAALLALAALAIPLLLHLQRRRVQPQRIVFAAMRWINEPLRPRRRLRLRDPWLLLLRCLLLATVVLALAQPIVRGLHDDTPWEVVLPGVDVAALDWRHGDGAERRWLAPGFPRLDDASPAAGSDTASLIRELDLQLPASTPLVLHVPDRISGLDGARLALGREVDWNIVPSLPAVEPVPRSGQPLRIAIAGADSDHPAMRYLQAAQRAWDASRSAAGNAGIESVKAPVIEDDPGPLPILAPGSTPERGTEAVAWLSPEALPAELRDWLADGGRVLAIGAASDDDSGVPLWRGARGATLRGARIGRGELRMLDCAFEPRCLPELLDPAFPTMLQAWLTPDPAPPAHGDARHVRPSRIERSAPDPALPMLPWLALLAGLLFLAERWLANGRRPA